MKQTSTKFQTNAMTESVYAAARQVWLAGLGAAAVSRDWAQHQSAPFFRSLVRQGTAVESRAIRFVGDRIENSMTRANTVWKHTRRTVESNVRQAADTAVTLAQQVLPKTLELPMLSTRATRSTAKATRKTRVVRAAAAKPAKRGKTTKRTAKGRTTRG